MPHLRQLVQLATVLLFLLGGSLTFAQKEESPADVSGGFFSQTDNDLTIRKVSVLPVADNLDGIYARPIEQQLINLVKTFHQWDYVESNLSNPVSASDLEDKPSDVAHLGRNIDADAFFVTSASKGPNGLSIKLDLFLKVDGKLFAQEILKDHPRFEINDLKEQVNLLFRKVIGQIPYQGLVLSRQQNRVTINLGKTDGLINDQVLTVIQILKAIRHPKFNFIVNTEKEILGKIKILKVDDTLSFGVVMSEKDKNAVRRFSKIGLLDSINYPVPYDLASTGDKTTLQDRPDSDVTFGKNPHEWLPVHPPSFGLAGVELGLGTYASSVNLTCSPSGACTSPGSLETKSSFYPSLGVFGELWVNPNVFIRAEMEQGIVSTDNPRSGSKPSTLNHAMSKYVLAGGYNFLLLNDFFGPKFTIKSGFTTYKMFVDDSSPRALTTVNYGGFLIALGGSLPVTPKRDWYVGGEFDITLFSTMSEQPVSSGTQSNNSIYEFKLWGEKKISENIHALGGVDFSLYSTNFSGAPGDRGTNEIATSLSQRQTRLKAGIEYLF